ncbi:type II toxin-antitoxin system RelE/ParE family toxin [bacterium]|nr:type II toxin-antitoxin system RelE/ParE family toxin [bacterium]
MITSFETSGTEDVFNGRNTKDARKICPRGLWKIAARKLEQLDSVERLDELKIPPGNRLEALSGGRKGQHSIRVNDQFQVCFTWTDQGPSAVEIVDCHRG